MKQELTKSLNREVREDKGENKDLNSLASLNLPVIKCFRD